jgi:putative (di)nucleoside polyphosphate hydrolase
MKVPETFMTADRFSLPYRPCVGAMILNPAGLVWIGHRYGMPGDPEGRDTWWQMPQGGIDEGEDPAQAVFREVQAETGITSVELIAELPGWHLYDLPADLLAKKVWGGRYCGQKQKWFALRFTGHDSQIDINSAVGPKAEFDAWRWSPATELIGLIVPFKRDVYSAVIDEARQRGII